MLRSRSLVPADPEEGVDVETRPQRLFYNISASKGPAGPPATPSHRCPVRFIDPDGGRRLYLEEHVNLIRIKVRRVRWVRVCFNVILHTTRPKNVLIHLRHVSLISSALCGSPTRVH